jgi:hypothetical protein
MDKLFLETEKGNLPIDQGIVDKYHLHKGTRSPFSHDRIIGQNGDYNLELTDKEEASLQGIAKDTMEGRRFSTDGTDNMDNGLAMSTSEIIDFSQGVDSSNR